MHVKEAINTKAVTPTSRSKRRTTAAQEERLQLALARLAQQESSSSDVKSQPQHQHPPEISVDKYYAVRRGRASNVIYTSWLGCKAQVHQYPGAEYKSFTRYDEAIAYLQIRISGTPPVSRRQGAVTRSAGDTDAHSRRIYTVGTQIIEPETEIDQGFRKFKIASQGSILGVLTTLWILLLLYLTRMR